MTRPTHTPQFENKAILAQACEVPGEDAYIRGASIALICCKTSELLDKIGALEVAER